ncbi:hypothetical protein PR001_g25584 [Phytophthora rubi]|uniref:HTH CENPB-type domain-containing protein n=1 Tax=Phytophthora rubi TaxID=129364 RepID=A0A6A3HYZ5_9STRA|nr:hypothetical protein PR001_g25584 [Phytophthora rubi]
MVKGRQKHTKNGRRKPRAYKLSVPTHQFRLNVVFFFEDHSMEETVDKFYKGLAGTQLRTKRTSVYLWRKRKARLVELCQSTGTATQRKVRLRGTGTTLCRDAEVHLVKWVNAYRVQGLPVSSLMLHRKALAVGRDIGIPVRIFAASRGWAKGFLRRHRMSLRARTRQGQIPPADANKALLDFNRQVKQRMVELGIDVAYNADQTPVFFEYLSTITTKGARTVWVRYTGKDKERFTKERHAHPSAAATSEFSGHWTDAVLACARDLNVELMRVPAGCTGVCQPADVAWNRLMKIRFRERWIAYLERQVERHEAAMAAAESFKMVAPAREDVVEYVAQAWDELSAYTIANGFKAVLQEGVEDEASQHQIN